MMIFLAEFPVQAPDSFHDHLDKLDSTTGVLSPAMIEDLRTKARESAARTHESLDHILNYDATWRTAVFRGEIEYDAAVEEKIESGLRNWLDLTESFLAKLQAARSWGFDPGCLETLRPRVVEVRNILTPDDEFFHGEALDDLAAKAIADHQAGLTVEFRMMGE